MSVFGNGLRGCLGVDLAAVLLLLACCLSGVGDFGSGAGCLRGTRVRIEGVREGVFVLRYLFRLGCFRLDRCLCLVKCLCLCVFMYHLFISYYR